MTDELDLSLEVMHHSFHLHNASRSFDIMPPSFNTVIRPQLNLHEEDEPNSTVSSGQLRLIKGYAEKSRRGFNSSDFDDADCDTDGDRHSSETGLRLSRNDSLNQRADTIEPIGFRERIYHIVDSSITTAILAVILLIDYVLFTLKVLLFLAEESPGEPLLGTFYRAVDWVTAIVFLTETNARLYSYGPWFYFSSALRCCEYFVSTTNTTFVVVSRFYSARWLGIMRFIRLIRIITIVVAWRERKLKWRTRQELETLAELLEKEKSDRSRLTKWRIESDDIAIGEKAGHGGFGTVFSGLFRGTLVAVKQLAVFEGDHTSISIEDEAITLVNLRHPNVVLFMGFVHEPSKLWIVTEYCSRGSLRDLLDDDEFPLTEGRALKLALGAARGLAYLHGQDPPVLHLDLKTSNILISSGWDAKLGDFGLSRNVDNIENCFSGTVQYAAPEVLEANLFSTAADIYSFGVCLWEIAAREVPFQGESPMSVLWGVVKSNLRPSLSDICVKQDDPESEGLETQNNVDLNTATEPKMRRMNDSDGNGEICVKQNNDQDAKYQEQSRTRAPAIPQHQVKVPFNSSSRRTQTLERAHSIYQESTTERKRSESLQGVRNTNNVFTKSHETSGITEGEGRIGYTIDPPQGNESKGFSVKHTTDLNIERDSDRSPFQRPGAIGQKTVQTNDRQEVGGQLDDLTRRVTATIHKFDDRPPVVRRKEGDESSRVHLEGTPRASDAYTTIQPNFSLMIKNTFTKKTFLRPSSTASRRIPLRRPHANDSFPSPSGTTEESEAFARRMANFSMHSNSRNVVTQEKDKAEESIALSHPDTPGSISDSTRRSKQLPVHVPKDYVDLIQRCWAQDPNQRPSASQIVWRLVLLIDGQMRDKSTSEQ